MKRVIGGSLEENLMKGIFTNRNHQGMVKYPRTKTNWKPLSPLDLKGEGEGKAFWNWARSVTVCEYTHQLLCVKAEECSHCPQKIVGVGGSRINSPIPLSFYLLFCWFLSQTDSKWKPKAKEAKVRLSIEVIFPGQGREW